jgi:signal transduction histidine kinase
MRQKTIIIFFFIALSFYSAGISAQTSGQHILLDGIHKFSPGDNPSWALQYYDDAQWQSIVVPGSWQAQGIKPEKGVGWYRIHFTVPESFKAIKPAILLGRIGDVDDVFLNGVKIGGEGLLSERFVEATKVERLYVLPETLLRYDSHNLIAIRVMNTYLNGGIFDKDVSIGDYNALLIKKFNRDRYTLILEFCFFTFFAVFFVTCFFFYLKGLRDKEYIYFWLFTSIYGILFMLGSVTFYNMGLKTTFIQQTINILSALLPVSLILLLMNVYQEKLNFSVKLFLMAFPLIALGIILFPGYTSRIYLYKVWKLFFVLAAVFIVFHAVRSYYKKINESGPILLGITGLVAGFILESVGGLDLLQITGFFLWDYSAVFFMICVMYALTSRYTRIKEELRSASLKIFDAHEDERKRLARELHDGVGQSLLSAKLRLKMLESKAKERIPIHEEFFSELMSDISHSIDEIRSIAMDLRPSFLENIEFVEAIKWHAGKIQEQSGIQINIHTAALIEIDSKLKENIYRIYQEALSNAIKHSGASTIGVILKMNTTSLSFEIKDDGKGFNPAQIEKRDTGIGLYTIKERVELLGGILRINSSDKIGTSIHIEVPLQ